MKRDYDVFNERGGITQMMEQGQVFHLPESPKQGEQILVIGVGGGGGNALNHIIDSGLEGVEFLAANTDAKALNSSKAAHKIMLGERLTKGRGAGANPQVGMDAAKESLDQVRELLQNVEMLFITAGMGGGTGTGAAPVIAEAAREMDILVVGVVTMPFTFEMKKRYETAKQGVAQLKEKVDALLIVENQKLLEISDDRMTAAEAYQMVNGVLRQAVQGVTEVILHPGNINVDFADIKSVMKNAGAAIMGIGKGEGENRAELAAKSAIRSPLMSLSPQGAKALLVNVTGSSELRLSEITEALEIINATADNEAQLIWGHTVEESMGSAMQITLIATGFPEAAIPSRNNSRAPVPPVKSPQETGTGGFTVARVRPADKEPGMGAGRTASDEVSLFPNDGDMFTGTPRTTYDPPAYYRKRQR